MRIEMFCIHTKEATLQQLMSQFYEDLELEQNECYDGP